MPCRGGGLASVGRQASVGGQASVGRQASVGGQASERQVQQTL